MITLNNWDMLNTYYDFSKLKFMSNCPRNCPRFKLKKSSDTRLPGGRDFADEQLNNYRDPYGLKTVKLS